MHGLDTGPLPDNITAIIPPLPQQSLHYLHHSTLMWSEVPRISSIKNKKNKNIENIFNDILYDNIVELWC